MYALSAMLEHGRLLLVHPRLNYALHVTLGRFRQYSGPRRLLAVMLVLEDSILGMEPLFAYTAMQAHGRP